MDNTHQTAINAALSQDWEKAILANKNILTENKNCVEALSRLAYAYIQIGESDKAKELYKKILILDHYNVIARKNLDKLNCLPKTSNSKPYKFQRETLHLSPSQFIEEPGKTKTITLINVAPVAVISKLHIGDIVKINPKKYTIEVRDQNNIFLGALPDDISFRIIRFLKAGNEYHICIKNIQKNTISVFIREIKRGKKYLCQPTFLPITVSYASSIPREIKRSDKENDNSEGEVNQEDSEE